MCVPELRLCIVFECRASFAQALPSQVEVARTWSVPGTKFTEMGAKPAEIDRIPLKYRQGEGLRSTNKVSLHALVLQISGLAPKNISCFTHFGTVDATEINWHSALYSQTDVGSDYSTLR